MSNRYCIHCGVKNAIANKQSCLNCLDDHEAWTARNKASRWDLASCETCIYAITLTDAPGLRCGAGVPQVVTLDDGDKQLTFPIVPIQMKCSRWTTTQTLTLEVDGVLTMGAPLEVDDFDDTINANLEAMFGNELTDEAAQRLGLH